MRPSGSQKLDIKKVGNFYIYMSPESILGSGTQATVYLAKRSTDDQIVAAKVFDITQNFTEKDLESIRRQLDILFTTKHPYILNCYDFIQTKNNIYLFSEYCNEGDLLQYIDGRPYISEAECLDLFKQIISALQVLDKNNIAHRDLKTANILMNKGQVKLADFGFAKRIENEGGQGIKNTYVGSPIFMSPQALRGGVYDLKKSDVWSAGICLYYMLFKSYPYNSQNEDLEELKSIVWNTPLTFPQGQNRSKQVKELISNMLNKDEDKRFNLNQVANHECLNYSSQQNINPLLRSSEMNQVIGISQYNQQYRDKALVQDKVVPPQYSQTLTQNMNPNNLMIVPEQISAQKEMRKRLIDIHNLLMLYATFPQKNSEIWRQIKSCSQNGQFKSFNDTSKKAIFLLMNTQYILSRKQMKEIISNSKAMISNIISKIYDNKQEVNSFLQTYFTQENYKCFIQNLQDVFVASEATHASVRAELFQLLESVGFNSTIEIIESNLEDNIDLALYNISQHIIDICSKAVQENNKSILTLFTNLLIVRYYEKQVAKFEISFETYYELIKKLENINFLPPQNLLQEIKSFNEKLSIADNSDDDDDDDDDDD